MVEVIHRERIHELTGEYLEPVHVGKILKEFLAEYDISQTRLAIMLRAPYVAVNEICNEKRGVSPEMAVRLEHVFSSLGVSGDFWLNIQKHYDKARERIKLKDELKKLEQFKIVSALDYRRKNRISPYTVNTYIVNFVSGLLKSVIGKIFIADFI